MTRQCFYEGCGEMVADWQTYCPRHYAQMMQQQVQEQQKTQQFQQKGQSPEPHIQKGMQSPKSNEEHHQISKKSQIMLTDKDKSIIRQVAFKGAIELMAQMDLESRKRYEDLISEVKVLTEEFEKILRDVY